MKMNKCGAIGISGYMGSGKSTVAAYLSRKGGEIIDVDMLAKQLMNSDDEMRQNLVSAFGEEICPENTLDFSLLGQRAYTSLESLDRLNRIVHPLLLHELSCRRNAACAGTRVFDAALIPLWHIEEWFDKLVWVEASFEIRLKRLLSKRSLSGDEQQKRMRFQQALFEKPHGALWIEVCNDGTIDQLERRLCSEDFAPVLNLIN